MKLNKIITQNKLLIWVIYFLALTSEVSFSEETLESKIEVTANSEESASDNNKPYPTELYTIKLHHKNKSSESLVYASFDESQQKYVVVCQSEDDRYQDALERCEDLKEDVNVGSSIKIAGLSRNTKDFRASEYKDKNIFLKLISYFSGYYPVKLDVILPKYSPKEFDREEQAILNNQNEENEKNEEIANNLENRVSKSQSFPPKKLKKSEYDYDIGDYTISKDDLSGEVNSGYSNFDIGMESLGIAGLLAVTEFAAYQNKWLWHGIGIHIQKELHLSDKDFQKLQSNSLTYILLENMELSQEAAAVLAGCNSLTHISLKNMALSQAAAAALAGSESLTYISLENMALSKKVARVLAGSESLTYISLENIALSQKVARVLAGSLAGSESLIRISLKNMALSQEVARVLAGSNSLTDILLENMELSQKAAAALAGSESLTAISLENMALSQKVARVLAGSESLTYILLENMELSQEAAAVLAGCNSLTHISLKNMALSQEAAAALAGSNSLTDILLENMELSQEAAAALAGSNSLTDILLKNMELSQEAAAALAGKVSRLY